MLDENDIVTAILNNADAHDALRVLARIAIREVALRTNTALPVEDITVIGKMAIDRLRRTVTVKGEVRPIKPRASSSRASVASHSRGPTTPVRSTGPSMSTLRGCAGSSAATR